MTFFSMRLVGKISSSKKTWMWFVYLEKIEKPLFFFFFLCFPVGTYLNCTARSIMAFRRLSYMDVQCFCHVKDNHIVLEQCRVMCSKQYLITWHCHGSSKFPPCNPSFVLCFKMDLSILEKGWGPFNRYLSLWFNT